MNKKALSLLLAASMVFSMNAVAFAEEAVVADEAAEVVTVVDADEVVEVEADDVVDTVSGINVQSSNTVSSETLSDGTEVTYNKTPLFTGKKITDAKMLNIKATVSGLSVSSQLTAEKIKLEKGVKKDKVGTVKFGITKFNKDQVKALPKDDKKKVKAFYKAQKSSLPLSMEIKPFSASFNNVTADTNKKPSTVSEGSYVVTIVPNKKDTKATVKIWSLNSKGKAKAVKVSSKDFSYSNKTVKFTNSSKFDTTVAFKISGNSVVKETVSAN